MIRDSIKSSLHFSIGPGIVRFNHFTGWDSLMVLLR
jgi:hypothetical protein